MTVQTGRRVSTGAGSELIRRMVGACNSRMFVDLVLAAKNPICMEGLLGRTRGAGVWRPARSVGRDVALHHHTAVSLQSFTSFIGAVRNNR